MPTEPSRVSGDPDVPTSSGLLAQLRISRIAWQSAVLAIVLSPWTYAIQKPPERSTGEWSVEDERSLMVPPVHADLYYRAPCAATDKNDCPYSMNAEKRREAALVVLGAQLERGYVNLPDVDLSERDLRRIRGSNIAGELHEGGQRISRPEDWQGANLSESILEGANMAGLDLRYARLVDARLSGADLRESILIRADLRRARLESAILAGANLSDALLEGANLEGADLRLARGLSPEQLANAIGDRYTVLPEGLAIPTHWTSRAR